MLVLTVLAEIVVDAGILVPVTIPPITIALVSAIVTIGEDAVVAAPVTIEVCNILGVKLATLNLPIVLALYVPVVSLTPINLTVSPTSTPGVVLVPTNNLPPAHVVP